MRKITISISEELVEYADSCAQASNSNRSQVIAMALAVAKSAQEADLAAEGYRFYAEEAAAFAEASGAAVVEVWDNTWSEVEEAADHGQAR
jgi:metal-responsive CopG/Arc/MetJ family transcriptional regulator